MLRCFLILIATLSDVFGEYPNELVLQDPKKVGQVVKTKLPIKNIQELPTEWDYRKLGLLTEDLNQHIPICKFIYEI